MTILANIEWLIVAGVIVLAVLVITTAAGSRRYTRQTQLKLCAGCGTSHPSHAAFCRRCGRKL